MTATVPAVWTEIVTTALLGTTRRPLPAEQPAWAPEAPAAAGASPEAQLLDLAAAHRVAAAAGRLPQRPPAGGSAAAPAGE
ncbi:DUF5691 domain-containing protein, partial [Microlunatus ginsengisoli]|uniref:DUF5691 domain-containing protein n=1 Tax=Microlunatus ginsengisoli TaxID=363863 RepID=UPI0031D0B3FC